MEKTKFTQEQIELLKANPYTKSVTPNQIRFTESFKTEFWQAYLKGQNPKEIFQDKGYDVDLIGDRRIQNTLYMTMQAQKSNGTGNESDRIIYLENEVSRLSFELDALKKIIALGNSRK